MNSFQETSRSSISRGILSQSKLNPENLSISQRKRLRFDTVVIEEDSIIKIVSGIHATAILAKEICGEYHNKIHWPELKNGKVVQKKNGYDPHLVVVLSDFDGNLSVKKGEDALSIIDGKVPEGFTVEFVPPQRIKNKL